MQVARVVCTPRLLLLDEPLAGLDSRAHVVAASGAAFATGLRGDDVAGHERPAGGDDHARPSGGDGGRPDRADGHAPRRVRAAGDPTPASATGVVSTIPVTMATEGGTSWFVHPGFPPALAARCVRRPRGRPRSVLAFRPTVARIAADGPVHGVISEVGIVTGTVTVALDGSDAATPHEVVVAAPGPPRRRGRACGAAPRRRAALRRRHRRLRRGHMTGSGERSAPAPTGRPIGRPGIDGLAGGQADGVLACPNCALPLTIGATVAACPSGHSFDRGRAGYLNLLVGGRLELVVDAPATRLTRSPPAGASWPPVTTCSIAAALRRGGGHPRRPAARRRVRRGLLPVAAGRGGVRRPRRRQGRGADGRAGCSRTLASSSGPPTGCRCSPARWRRSSPSSHRTPSTSSPVCCGPVAAG